MDKNNIIIIILVIIIIALAALIGASFVSNNQNEDIKVFNNTIAGVGTFNSTNITNFTLSNSSNDQQTDYVGSDDRA